ncbi:CTP synthase [bacterium]|nr:CTP synthase [bacterium]
MPEDARETRYVFVTGGVCSSLGKGVAAASLGCLLESRGYKVALQKFDPYINVDPGTMSPYQHGEVYVTDDGAETDLDLGYYERFTNSVVTRLNSVSTGQVYDAVIKRERRGGYLGKTVQVIPHITDEIKRRIVELSEYSKADIQIIEIGGTVGDIEGVPFLEAIRQMALEVGRARALFIHLTLIPLVGGANELKTKPTQHSVMKLREIGISPDILLCRVPRRMSKEMRDKIALFCNVQPDSVVNALDIKSTVYEIPLMYQKEGLDELVLSKFGLPAADRDLASWRKVVDIITTSTRHVRIGVVGKYIKLQDSYRSIYDGLIHGGVANRVHVDIVKIFSEDLEEKGKVRRLANLDGILVPWGFGKRGTEGKIAAISYARKNKLPFFGICLGMQLSVAEFARNACKLKGANSTELDPNTPHPVICLMEEQKAIVDKGGTMRLGAYPCVLEPDSLVGLAYGAREISERHRHRYEFNNAYRDVMEAAGMRFSGTSPNGELVEIIELVDHPWFVACQFHPELKSRPRNPHPLFREFIRAATEHAGD